MNRALLIINRHWDRLIIRPKQLAQFHPFFFSAVRALISIYCNDHYNDIIMSAMASQITSLTTVYLTFYSGADQRKHQSSASLAFVRGIHRWPVNSPHKGPVARKMFPFDDVIIYLHDSWLIMLVSPSPVSDDSSISVMLISLERANDEIP